MNRSRLVLAALSLALANLSREQPRVDDLRGVPLSDLELGPNGIQRKRPVQGSPADPIRRHRKQHR